VIVSESLARKYWPGQDPIGKRLKWGVEESKGRWLTIVGVVGDVKPGALDQATVPHSYEPYSQQTDEYVRGLAAMNFALRASGDPASHASAVRAEGWSLDSQLAVAQLLPMNDIVEKSLTGRRFNLFLLVAFAGLALALAAIGTYGVVSYSVSRRTHELGIRTALGAGRGDVLKLIAGQGFILAATGIAFGVCGALVLTRFLSTLLYQVPPRDPATLAAVSALIGIVAVAASLVPAWRATRVDPNVALRHE
jgi:putative ABC transport system permease protein